MIAPVPLGIGGRISEPEVGRQVDDFEIIRQGGDDLLRGPVWQTGEDRRHLRQIGPGHGRQRRQIEPAQMGMDLSHGLARPALGGQHLDLGLGMVHEQAHQLGSGIAAGA